MLRYLEPVPFTIDVEAHLGLTKVEGLLSADESSLLIEYVLADAILGALKTGATEFAVPLEEIASIRFVRKFFGMSGKIHLKTRRQKSLEGMPESSHGGVVLAIKRSDHQEAENFCLSVSQALMRQRNERMAEELEMEERGRLGAE